MHSKHLKSISKPNFWPMRRFDVNSRQLHPVAGQMVSEATLAKHGHRVRPRDLYRAQKQSRASIGASDHPHEHQGFLHFLVKDDKVLPGLQCAQVRPG